MPYSNDKIKFTAPADAYDEYDEYSDDVYNGKHASNGNGIYNDYTIDLQPPQQYKEPLKICCLKFQNTRRTKFVLFGGLAVVLLSLILIIVAASKTHQSATPPTPRKAKDFGLIAYGPDQHGVISYNPVQASSYMEYFNRIEHHFGDYNTLKQMNDLDHYMLCHANTTSVPSGKTCMQTETQFGPNCHQYDMYGIQEGRPCVLLVLKLPENLMPEPFNVSNPKNKELVARLDDSASNQSVGLSCQGKTEADKKMIGESRFAGPPIVFHPSTGYPLYFYKWRSSPLHLNPGVMVQFNTIPLNHKVTVKCTAWAKNFNDGLPQDSEVYSTEFTFSLHQ